MLADVRNLGRGMKSVAGAKQGPENVTCGARLHTLAQMSALCWPKSIGGRPHNRLRATGACSCLVICYSCGVMSSC